ncbi:MAG: hypothetical protein AAGK00_07345 [Pseudomonadota bacterium]
MTIKTNTPAEILDADLDVVIGAGDDKDKDEEGTTYNELGSDLPFGDRGDDLVGGTHDDNFVLGGGSQDTRSTSGHYTQVVWAKR